MGVYIPLKVRLAKASIPQVVAYIQTYLEDNPIPAMDTFAELIAEFLADHPELVAVASVNAKTGAVILTGADIMLNADADVTLNTEITNLNSMIASLSSQVAQAVTTVGGFETSIENINDDIDTINVALDTKDTEIYQINQTLTNHLNSINANTTKNAQQDTRLTALETALDDLENDYDDLNTHVNLHSEQITALQGMKTSITTLENNYETLSTRLNAVETDTEDYDPRISVNEAILNGISRKYTTPTTSWVVGFYLSAWGLVVPTTSGWNLTISNSQVFVGGTWYPINLSSVSTVPVGRFIVFDAPTGVQCVDGTAYMVSLEVQAD